MHSKGLQIAIDGPASAGKSTVAKKIAKKYSYIYCDTGAMYRSVTLKALWHHLPLQNKSKITQMLAKTQISFKPNPKQQKVFIDGEEVTNTIRNEEVTNNVSTVAAIPGVRHALTYQQRKIAKQGGVVMDGRDIGTTVLPHAQVKIFLVASVRARAKRRFKDNQQREIKTSLPQLIKEIKIRDYKDSHRKLSPLVQAHDAIRVDTTGISVSKVVEHISQIIDKKLK